MDFDDLVPYVPTATEGMLEAILQTSMAGDEAWLAANPAHPEPGPED